jgi:small-conductance mechanosensitive channel
MNSGANEGELMIIILIFFIFLALLPNILAKKTNENKGFIKFMSIANAIMLIPSMVFDYQIIQYVIVGSWILSIILLFTGKE